MVFVLLDYYLVKEKMTTIAEIIITASVYIGYVGTATLAGSYFPLHETIIYCC